MRCTKCHYLSFEPEPRCRNCGHDLSIDELSLPLDELTLDEPVRLGATEEIEVDLDLGPSLGRLGREGGGAAVATMTPPAMPKPVAAPVTTELPLFMRETEPIEPIVQVEPVEVDDEPLEPLIRVPARPRAPLSVRRTTPDPARLRARYAPEPDLLASVEEPLGEPVRPTPFLDEPVLHAPEPEPVPRPAAGAAVPFGARVKAAAIDVGVLLTIGAVTTALTLRMAELSWSQVSVLPIVPMVGFLALIGLGYEWMFTAAAGQTIGKMLTGLRVIADDSNHRPSMRQSAVRAATMLPLGAGLVAAMVGPGLALHDRVAHTRVVRA